MLAGTGLPDDVERVTEISADGRNLIALDPDSAVYYTKLDEICGKLMEYGHRSRPGAGPFIIDDLAAAEKENRKNILVQARDAGLPPELPDMEIYEDQAKGLAQHKAEDKYPFWLSLGIVYEHFHTSKTIRGATTLKLVASSWIFYQTTQAPGAKITKAVLYQGVLHILGIVRPLTTTEGKSQVLQLKAHYREQIEKPFKGRII